MRAPAVALLILVTCSGTARAAQEPPADSPALIPEHPGFVSFGVGLPSLLHAEVGVFISPRVTIEGRWADVLFNSLAGIGATWSVLPAGSTAPPRHALLLSGELLLNLAPPLSVTSSGERLGFSGGAHVGYAFHSDFGFYLRGFVGTLVYWEQGIALGPDATIGVGWTF